jgi:hypothetical protein
MVVETDRGRVEVIVPKGASGEKVVAALKTNIDKTATLTLKTATAGKSGVNAEMLLVSFEISQAKPITGRAVAHAKAGGGLLDRGIRWFKSVLSDAFGAVREGVAANTAADYIIEVNRRTDVAQPGWRVEWRVEIQAVGMRFVAVPIPPDSRHASSPEG